VFGATFVLLAGCTLAAWWLRPGRQGGR
jgi:hypothetical protein